MDKKKNAEFLVELKRLSGKDNVREVAEGRYVVTGYLMSVEFWKGEYAKRHIYIENRDCYGEVVRVIEFLRDVCVLIFDKRPEFFRKYSDPYWFEFIILNYYAYYKSLSVILKKDLYEYIIEKYNDAEYLINKAYELSKKYKYIITDMEIDTKFYEMNEHQLIKLVEEEWKSRNIEHYNNKYFLDIEGDALINLDHNLTPRKFNCEYSYENEKEYIDNFSYNQESLDNLFLNYKKSINNRIADAEIEFRYLSMQINYSRDQQYKIKKEIFDLLCKYLGFVDSVDIKNNVLYCICMENEKFCDSDINYLQSLVGCSLLDVKGKCQNFKENKFICPNTGLSVSNYTNCCVVKSISRHLNVILNYLTSNPENIGKISSDIIQYSFFNTKKVKNRLHNYIILDKGISKQSDRLSELFRVLDKGNLRSSGLTNRVLGLVVWDAINIYEKTWKDIFEDLNVVTKNIDGFLDRSQEQNHKKLQTDIYRITNRCINEGVLLTLP